MKVLYTESPLVTDKEETIMKQHIIGSAFCMLFLVAVFPVSSTTVPATTPTSQTTGNTLHVGGLGPNNYTTIQDAVNAAFAGDTVFVYDDSSPYQENVAITTPISLLGEQKTTTVIDGMNQGYSIDVTADDVTINGFTIINGNDSGILINSNNTMITNNIFTEDIYAIRTTFGQAFGTNFSHNTITHNDFENNGAGISFFSGSNNTIADNHVAHNEQAILLMGGRDNNISGNTVTENGYGIWILSAYRTTIYRNNITYNSNIGIITFITSADRILQNNFMGNNKSAISYDSPLSRLRMLTRQFHIPLRRNVWRQNYWDEPRTLPYVIPGVFLKHTLQIDWRPALKPYVI